MSIFLSILISTGVISLLSLFGALFLFSQKDLLKRISIFLLAFAAGALMGNAFLHILPRAAEKAASPHSFLFVLFGFGLFFVIENILHWHHTHQGEPTHKVLGTLSLLGDGAHNFLDGLIIAAVFFIDIKLGFATTLAIALHEIPQELAEFGVLVHSGMSKARALFLNFLSASMVVLGGMVSFLLAGVLGSWVNALLLLAVGIFVYVAASDFVPEIRKEQGLKKSIGLLFTFAAGISLMWIALFLE